MSDFRRLSHDGAAPEFQLTRRNAFMYIGACTRCKSLIIMVLTCGGGGVGIFRAIENTELLKNRHAQNALASEIAPNWNVSGTQTFRINSRQIAIRKERLPLNRGGRRVHERSCGRIATAT